MPRPKWVRGVFSYVKKSMSTEQTTQKLTLQDVDKKVFQRFLKVSMAYIAVIMVIACFLSPTELHLAHRFPETFGWTSSLVTPRAEFPRTATDASIVFKSVPVILIGMLGFVLAMGGFWLGIMKFSEILVEHARIFAQEGEWENVATVLSSFNNSGQHFLDRSGEAHYLLSVALRKTGKGDMSRIARDFVLKRRSKSEWADKLREASQAITPHGSSPANRRRKSRPKN